MVNTASIFLPLSPPTGDIWTAFREDIFIGNDVPPDLVHGTLAANLGALNGTLSGHLKLHGTFVAALGSLTATLTAHQTIHGVFLADLGALSASLGFIDVPSPYATLLDNGTRIGVLADTGVRYGTVQSDGSRIGILMDNGTRYSVSLDSGKRHGKLDR